MIDRLYANPLNSRTAVGARVRRSVRTLHSAANWSIFTAAPCGTFVKMHGRRPEEEAS